jgi:hypothetical protein
MKLLIETAMIFFGTLLCAAVVALGAPVDAQAASARGVVRSAHEQAPRDADGPRSLNATAAAVTAFGLGR